MIASSYPISARNFQYIISNAVDTVHSGELIDESVWRVYGKYSELVIEISC